MTYRELAMSLSPELKSLLESDSAEDTWCSPPKEGKSLELVTLVSLYSAAQELGAHPALPAFVATEPELYFLRNEYPHQHGAQAGHSAISHSLSKRFLGALTPKFSFDVEGTTYSLFREGYPLHLVNYYLESGSSYRDRPDFVVVQGRYLASSRNSICTYTVEVDGKVGRAEFREIDSMSPQVVSWELPPDVIRPPLAAFECSWNKRPKTAAKQLDRYRNLFGMSEGPNSFFVSAREQMEEVVPTITVGPNESRAREITGRFAEALGLALELRSNR